MGAPGQRRVGDTVVSRPFIDTSARTRSPQYTVVIFNRKSKIVEYARFRSQEDALDFYLQVLEHGERG